MLGIQNNPWNPLNFVGKKIIIVLQIMNIGGFKTHLEKLLEELSYVFRISSLIIIKGRLRNKKKI